MNNRAASNPASGKIVCLGLNYRDHAAETGLALPRRRCCSRSSPNSLIGPGDAVVLPPASHPGRLRGRAGGRDRPARQAHRRRATRSTHVAGYWPSTTSSARDLQFADGAVDARQVDRHVRALRARARPRATRSATRRTLAIRCRVNGEAMQDSPHGQMIFGVAEIIAFLSAAITLEPGDIIATGTPAGVGVSRARRRCCLNDGDVVEVEIEGLGPLPTRSSRSPDMAYVLVARMVAKEGEEGRAAEVIDDPAGAASREEPGVVLSSRTATPRTHASSSCTSTTATRPPSRNTARPSTSRGSARCATSPSLEDRRGILRRRSTDRVPRGRG